MAQVYPNEMPSEIASDKAEGIRVGARPVWLEFCAFVIWIFTLVLVFAGASAISGWIWPKKTRVAHFLTLLLFAAWITAAAKLEIFGKRRAVPAGRRYRLAAEFLLNSFTFSSVLIVFDVWQGHAIGRVDVVSACVKGLLFGAGMLWVVPRFPSSREDPFPTKRNFPNPGIVGQPNARAEKVRGVKTLWQGKNTT